MIDPDLRKIFEDNIAQARLQASRAKRIADDETATDVDRFVAAALAEIATIMANSLSELLE